MVTSVACLQILFFIVPLERLDVSKCLCGISTKELLQCVFLIISNCLWNLAITTVIPTLSGWWLDRLFIYIVVTTSFICDELIRYCNGFLYIYLYQRRRQQFGVGGALRTYYIYTSRARYVVVARAFRYASSARSCSNTRSVVIVPIYWGDEAPLLIMK